MNIGSIILFVKDMKAVTAFYRDVVGLSQTKRNRLLKIVFSALIPGSANCVCIIQVSRTMEDKRLSSMLRVLVLFIKI